MAEPIQDLPGENWKPVVGYEGLYEVSDHGRVKSLSRQRGHQFFRGRILRPYVVLGYSRVCLSNRGADKNCFIHRIELEAFVGPCPEGMEGCHNNGDPANNMLPNLRWDTHLSNSADKAAHGTVARGERVGTAKLTFSQVAEIRAALDGGVTTRVLAAQYHVTMAAIRYIRGGVTWKEPLNTGANQ